MEHTIELRKVSKYYAGESGVSMGFARIDLTLDMGEFVAITGESGSGKSTLLNVISGLDSYDEGEMFVCGEDTTAFQTKEYEEYRKTYIGNIFQDFNLVNSYTVYQNIELVMLMCGKKASECKERIEELLELVGLTEYKKTKASKLSGGQKQRVAIARALAKDAPIIVADEPTGNLDSESARVVMETLAKISRDRLVVIVTHNYEQAEPFVTRKITMHDGRIIENQNFRKNNHVIDEALPTSEESVSDAISEQVQHEANETINNDMKKSSEVRLGIRNAFNLPTKFILLFIVYLFVATAILSQYAAARNSQYNTDLLGYNQYFTDTSAERILVTKPDRSPITDEEIAKLRGISNIDSVVVNDIAIDQGVSLELKDYTIEASVFPIDQIKEKDLTYGRMPAKPNEVVLYSDSSAMDFYYIKDQKNKLLGLSGSLKNNQDSMVSMLGDKLEIVGIITKEEAEGMNWAATSRLYMSEDESIKLKTRQTAAIGRTVIDFGKNTVSYDGGIWVVPSTYVPKGEAYISEDDAVNYGTDNVKGKPITVKTSNSFFNEALNLKVGKVFNKKSLPKDLGLSKDDYDGYSNRVFISAVDYETLYNKGTYQVSAYMKDATAYAKTTDEIKDAGLSPFLIKDSLTDITGGYTFVISMLQYAMLLVVLLVVFYVSYMVIRLIMKSRNSYYSTLRILGASKKNTDMVLRVELLLMMALAYAADMVLVVLVNAGIVNMTSLRSNLHFLTPFDYIILLAGLLVMSLLIANRYSRKIFTKSAMTAYRGEV